MLMQWKQELFATLSGVEGKFDVSLCALHFVFQHEWQWLRAVRSICLLTET